MKRSILRYGVFVILLVMSLGLLLILDRFEIRLKASVNLIVTDERTCIAYVANNKEFNPCIEDSIAIRQTIGGDVFFIVKGVKKEPSYVVLQLCPIDEQQSILQKFGKNTFSQGYIFTGKTKLRELVLEKIKM